MFTRSLLGFAVMAVGVAFFATACGDNGGSLFGNDVDSGSSSGGYPLGGFGQGSGLDAGNPLENDPLPTYCLLDGGAPPTPVTGTPECPSDKNAPGCPCSEEGQTAPCWTGLRKNRNRGQCKDGTTTCQRHGEIDLTWTACSGEVLPAPGATQGQSACSCFSAGKWALTNTSPCFVYENNSPTTYAASSVYDGKKVMCPTTVPPTLPAPDWSQDTIEADCAGHFKLCYEIKAGSFDAPSASDCSMSGKQCVEADYPTENVVTPFPNLKAWVGASTSCTAQFMKTGGYGEMTVEGHDSLCNGVDDGNGHPRVFNRVKYCPLSCNAPGGSTDPMCAGCGQGSSGSF